MLTRKLYTIQAHLDIEPNRYTLCQIIMKRTKELINGAPPKSGLDAEFEQKHRGEIPNQSIPKLALEEFRLGKLNWTEPVAKKPEVPLLDLNIFSPPTI